MEICEDMTVATIIQYGRQCETITVVPGDTEDEIFEDWMRAVSRHCHPLNLHIVDGCEALRIPDVFNRFQRLVFLEVNEFAEIEELPRSLFSIKTLKKLHLENLGRVDRIRSLNDLVNLETLIIRNLAYLNTFPLRPSLPKLEYFEMSHCPSSNLPSNFKGLPNLRELMITGSLADDQESIQQRMESLHPECRIHM